MAKTRSVRSTLTSRSKFITDLIPTDVLYLCFVRAKKSCGVIKSITCPDFPENTGLILPSDIPGKNSLDFFGDSMPLLAELEIVYRGQPYGLVYAPTLDQAQKLADGVAIVYTSIADPLVEISDQTLYSSDQWVWDENPETGDDDASDDSQDNQETDEIALEQEISSTFTIQPQFQAVQETLTAVALWEQNSLTIHAPSIWPHHLSKNLKSILRMKGNHIDVQATIPGRYHDRLLVDTAFIAAAAGLAAHILGRSVVLSYSHSDEVLFSTKQAPISCTHTLTIHPDNGLKNLDILIQINQGAYPLLTKEIMNQCLGSANPGYRCPRGKIKVEIHRTNLAPLSIFHGFLSPQIQGLMEIQINRIAHILQLDPLDLRMGLIDLRKKTRAKGLPGIAQTLTMLPTVNESSDFSRKFASFEVLRRKRQSQTEERRFTDFQPLRGIGAALGMQGNGLSQETETKLKSSGRLRLESDGSAHFYANTTPGSSTIKSYVRDILRDTLGVQDEVIHLSPSTSLLVPDAGPMCSSRSLSLNHFLSNQLCISIQQQRFRNPLPLEVTKVFHPPKNSTVTGRPGGYPWLNPSWAAAVVEAKVDPVSYLPWVSGIWMVVQAGSILNTNHARAHIQGTIIQSLDWVLHQRWQIHHGYLIPRSTSDMKISGLLQIPQIHIDFVDDSGLPISEKHRHKDSPQPQGIGELAQSLIPPALLSALSQATGQFFDQIPITPELIHRYMESP